MEQSVSERMNEIEASLNKSIAPGSATEMAGVPPPLTFGETDKPKT